MQRNKAIIWGTLILAAVLCIGALMLPIPASWPPDNVDFHQQLIVNIIMAATHTGGAVLFLTNLDVYKAKLRRAYITLALGTLITGAGTLQISLLTLLDAWQTLYARSGATMLPFVLSGIVMYLGVRAFARLVGTTHFLTKAWLVLPGVVLLAAATTLLPHAHDPRIPEVTYDVLVGVSTWSGSLILLAGWLAHAVKQNAGAHYTSAMAWLTRALFFSSFVLFYQAIYTLINLGYDPILNAISNLITVVSGLIWIRAGYAFALTKYYNEDVPLLHFLFSQTEVNTGSRPETAIDMVTYAAGLVSNSRDIDPLLDNVRSITARLDPGQKPSPEQTQSLVTTYMKIEHYLVTKEAIRNYTRQELRKQFDPSLQKLLTTQD